MVKPPTRNALVAYGILIGVTYLVLMAVKAAEAGAPTPQALGLLLLGTCLVTGGGGLFAYDATRRSGHRLAAPLRSLGVAATLGTLLGALILGLDLVAADAPLAQLSIPLFAFETSISLGLLWLQTFPITSPTARRIVSLLLLSIALACPILMAYLLRQDPLQPWIAAMSAGWLLVLLARPRLQDKALDAVAATSLSRAKAPKASKAS
jgi:hypothetical protein